MHNMEFMKGFLVVLHANYYRSYAEQIEAQKSLGGKPFSHHHHHRYPSTATTHTRSRGEQHCLLWKSEGARFVQQAGLQGGNPPLCSAPLRVFF